MTDDAQSRPPADDRHDDAESAPTAPTGASDPVDTSEDSADWDDSTDGTDPTGDSTDRASGPTGGRSRGRERRDVVVPDRLYKTVTVFSTLIAVVGVVLGFALLDAATLQVSFLRALVGAALAAVGLDVSAGALTAAFALLGLASIGFGAAVYVIGTRFRARGMGNSQEDSDEGSDNG